MIDIEQIKQDIDNIIKQLDDLQKAMHKESQGLEDLKEKRRILLSDI